MRTDLTCIYYTSHTEKSSFEEKIKSTLLSTIGNLPLISVSQKPIDFGKNICVGNVGISAFNAWRQLQIGTMAAKTKYICAAESDFLYPKEYFEFVPNDKDYFFIPKPVYILFVHRGVGHSFYEKPRGSEGVMLSHRDKLLYRLEEMFKGLEDWRIKDTGPLHLFGKSDRKRFDVQIPPISFKTPEGMSQKTQFTRETRTRILPYWGNCLELIAKYYS